MDPSSIEKGQRVRTKLRRGSRRPSVSTRNLEATKDDAVGTVLDTVSFDKTYAWFVGHDQFRVRAYYPDELTLIEDKAE
jgi:hypothetical protein